MAIMVAQSLYGSRFFLPPCLRTRTYSKYMKTLAGYDFHDWRYMNCQLCMNLLSEPELEHSDADPEYAWKSFKLGNYMEIPCKHVFHPNCILKAVRKNKRCPICEYILPEDSYDD